VLQSVKLTPAGLSHERRKKLQGEGVYGKERTCVHEETSTLAEAQRRSVASQERE
jgi:hypothetical protein